MHKAHFRTYDFLATYLRIIREVDPPLGNDVDLCLKFLQNDRPRKPIKEPAEFQEIYDRINASYSNMLTRLHYTKWSIVRDISLYNFIAQFVYPDAYQRESLNANTLLEIEVPDILVCPDQKHRYYL